MVALKRLDDAIRDGNPIRAVIRNSGANQDGKTTGIMVPKSEAQRDLIESVYRGARLDPRDTPVVEAHGTGTAVGDPLEVAAIREAFRRENCDSPLYVGSIKPNIGHLESASGIAGLIKGILMLEHGKIPATIGIETLKPSLRLDEFGIEIPDQMMDWPPGYHRRLSLNSFGYGGTNAHAILEGPEYVAKTSIPNRLTRPIVNGAPTAPGSSTKELAYSGVDGRSCAESPASNHLQIIALTARSADALSKISENVRQWALSQTPTDTILQDLAFTLGSHRSFMQHRIAFSARSLSDVIGRLDPSSIIPTKASRRPQPLFIFTGQGAQWYAMGRELLRLRSPFRGSLQRSEDVLNGLGAEWSLIEELLKEEGTSRINESEISQPATTALQLALVDFLAEVGIKPRIVVGHSSGEIAAAYAAGALDQENALKAAYFRGRIARKSALQQGAMLAVGLGETEAAPYVHAAKSGRAVVACANSPSSSTVSGDEAAITEIEIALRADGIFARKLAVDRAYHSHHMREAADGYLQDLDGLEHGLPADEVTFISSVIGLKKTTAFGPEYWVDNLVSKVRFAEAVREALRGDDATLSKPTFPIVEIGPHNALAGPVRQILTSIESPSGTSQHSALLRRKNAVDTVGTLAAELLTLGCPLNIERLHTIFSPHFHPRVLTSLPSYPWNRSTKYWHESRLSKEHRFRKHPYHDLLGVRSPIEGSPRPVWRHLLSVSRLPWLREHIIDGEIIYPAAGYVCMVLEAMRQVMEDRNVLDKVTTYQLRDVSFVAPLVIPEIGKPIEVQLRLTPVDGSDWDDFRIYGIDQQGTSIEHCRGSVIGMLQSSTDDIEGHRVSESGKASSLDTIQRIRTLSLENVDTVEFYQRLRSRGNVYGQHFAAVGSLKVDNEHALSRLQIPDMAECMPAGKLRSHLIHPAVIDAFLHPTVALCDRAHSTKTMVTAGIDALRISVTIQNSPGTVLDSYTTLRDQWNQTCTTDVEVFQGGANAELEPVVQMEGLRIQALGMIGNGLTIAPIRKINYRLEWKPDVDHITPKDVNPALGEIDDASIAQASKLQTLNRAAALYIDQCLKQFDHLENANIQGNYERLLHWMKRFQKSKEHADLLASTPGSSTDLVLQESRQLGVEGEILARIGENLVPIMTNATDPLSLITEQDLLWRLYADDDASVRCYGFAINYLRHLIFKDPNLAVLELGAGTGGATEPILQALSSENGFPFHSYEFTDVSAAFFERSKQRLQRWDGKIAYRKLDIQDDPVTQGFQEGSYDLVLASNVLHVAHSVDEALGRIQKLLKPGGRVLLIETTRNVPFLNTAIGVLPGWWGATDGRIDGPLLSETQWDAALARNGLGGAALVAKDFEGAATRSAMIVSRPLSTQKTVRRDDMPTEILLCPNWTGKRAPLIDDLASTLSREHGGVPVTNLASRDFSSDTVYVVIDDGSKPALISNDDQLFKTITHLVSSAALILWISVQEHQDSAKNPEKALVTGFARTARVENKSLQFVTLDVQDAMSDKGVSEAVVGIVEPMVRSFKTTSSTGYSMEQDCIFRNGQLHISRVIPDNAIDRNVAKSLGDLPPELQPFHQHNRPLRLSLEKTRFLDKLEFVEDCSLQEPLDPAHLEIDVQACGVNFKDVLIANGYIKKKLKMAGEFSGIVIEVGTELKTRYKVGDRVCGFGATPYASRVRVRGDTVGKLTSQMSFTAGASIPVIFATAYHALVEVGRLEKDHTVLIHSAAGGVGQAAIAIAQWIGARIFATVGSATKKALLMEEFGIPEDQIFSSRSNTFKEGVLRLTNGQGIDVVLNSLSGQMLQDSMSCVARFGTFVELGKSDAQSGTRVSMAPFDSSITVSAIDLSMINRYRPATVGRLIQKVLSLVEANELRAPALTTLPLNKIGEAFRMMQNRTHTGKIVLDAGPNAMVDGQPKKESASFASDATYIIAGGRAGVGYEIAKYLVRNGARHIVLLSRRVVNESEESEVRKAFKNTGATMRLLSCDITNLAEVQERLSCLLEDMPPVRGLIQSTMVRRDVMLSDMNEEDFRSSIAPKVAGTQNLINALGRQPVKFFLMLSSIVGGIVGSLAEANYAAANAYLNALARSQTNSSCRFIAVCPGVVEDIGVVAGDEKARKILERQGFLSMTAQNVIGLVDYALSEEGTRRGCNEIVSGFDRQSIQQGDHSDTWENPLFSHIPQMESDQLASSSEKATESIESSLARAATREDAEAVVSHAIAVKIGTLVALGEEEIDESRSVADFGIDSLVVVELKNWIAQVFQSRLHNVEISDAPSIVHLARLIGAKSPLLASKPSSESAPEPISHISFPINVEPDSGYTSGAEKEEIVQPMQPLPDLDSSLEHWLTAVRPGVSDEDYEKARSLLEDFRKPGGEGRKLQGRLAALANDPLVDNWQEDLYKRFHHLKLRMPLMPQWNFSGTHFNTQPHSAAERAAVIANACITFSRKLDSGDVDPEIIREQRMSTSQYQWFFNATREPQKGEDVMRKYPRNDYLVAFRHGRAFKVDLDVPIAVLKARFQQIIDSPCSPESWVGVLTTDDRDAWAENRKLLQEVSPANAEWLHLIEAAVTVIYLDDAKPETPRARGVQFMHADGFNRWCDKTVQFVVCDNGWSGTIGEHSLIDGYGIRRLNSFIQEAIGSHIPSHEETGVPDTTQSLDSFAFDTTPELERQMLRAQQELRQRAYMNELAAFETRAVGADFFRRHKIPPKSGLQMAIQLASRKFFGYNPLGHETVSLAHFLKGRVEINHTLWPAVKTFCDAVAEQSMPKEALRELLLEGIKAHASNLMRCTRGQGIDRHLLCLAWSVEEGEEMPEFLESEIYQASRPRYLMTDCLETGVLEAMSLPAALGGLWVHFEPEDDKVRFSIWGPVGEVDRVEGYVKESVELVREILEG